MRRSSASARLTMARRKGARFFIGTDAAAEGINLQFCGSCSTTTCPGTRRGSNSAWAASTATARSATASPSSIWLQAKRAKARSSRPCSTSWRKSASSLARTRCSTWSAASSRACPSPNTSSARSNPTTRPTRRRLTLRANSRVEQVRAIAVREESIYGKGGEVVADLPKLRDAMAIEEIAPPAAGLRAPLSGTRCARDRHRPSSAIWAGSSSCVHAQARRAWSHAAPARYPTRSRHAIASRSIGQMTSATRSFCTPASRCSSTCPPLAIEHARRAALRGAIFTDVSATAPYLLHVARVTVVRGVDPGVP
jgi:hypothetical protein